MGLLSDKVVLVTGASSGFGQATAIRAAEESATLILLDSHCMKLENTLDRLPETNQSPLLVLIDVQDENAWIDAVDNVIQQFGKLDGLVNCFEEYTVNSIKDSTLQDFQHSLSVNLETTFLGVKYGYLTMKELENGGSIVNVSSILGQKGSAKHTAFSAAKGGSRLMAKAAAIEFGLANSKVRVNSVHPSLIYATGGSNQSYQREVAATIVYLLSDGAAFMTGSEVTIDNGLSCALPSVKTMSGELAS